MKTPSILPASEYFFREGGRATVLLWRWAKATGLRKDRLTVDDESLKPIRPSLSVFENDALPCQMLFGVQQGRGWHVLIAPSAAPCCLPQADEAVVKRETPFVCILVHSEQEEASAMAYRPCQHMTFCDAKHLEQPLRMVIIIYMSLAITP